MPEHYAAILPNPFMPAVKAPKRPTPAQRLNRAVAKLEASLTARAPVKPKPWKVVKRSKAR